MKIKNDIKWLKEKGFITEVKTPGALTTKSQLNKYVGQIAPSSDIFDSKIKPLGEYLTFEFLENGSFSFSKDGLSYSLDNGTSWNTLSASTNITVSNGDKVLFKGEYTNTTAFIGQFKMVSKFNISGNIMSLLFGDKFIGETDLTRYNSAFDHLFENTAVVDASKLVLPATKLSTYCYGRMFYNCASLTAAPELPATTLTQNCYNSMFYGCTSLAAAPELPATTLAASCYVDMFHGCSSLTTAPELPATKLASSCYNSMFYGCTSLTAAPELPATDFQSSPRATYCCQSMFYGCSSLTTAPSVLPATKLVNFCYSSMFNGCTSLTAAPVLPATILADGCYNKMFSGCSKLNHIEALFTTTPSYSYTDSWVDGVSSTGTFVKNAAATWDVTGTSGIPEGWTVMTVVVDTPAQPLNA